MFQVSIQKVQSIERNPGITRVGISRLSKASDAGVYSCFQLIPRGETMSKIHSTMTVKEAAEHLSEFSRVRLQRWGDTFGIPLKEFHIGHIRTYQSDRAKEAEAQIVDMEVAALLMLLRELNLSGQIERLYRPLAGPAKLKVVKADDGRCLHREQYVKKDGALSKIKRQCSRLAQIHDGRFTTLCAEHQTEVNEAFLRAVDPNRPRLLFVPGSRTVQ